MATTPATVTSTQLQWLAEAADGMQNQQKLVLAKFQENGGPPMLGIAEAGQADIQEVVATIESTPLVRDRVKVSGVQIRLEGTDKWVDCKTPEGQWADAVFCTESAMQKFVITYYHNQRLLTPRQWDKLDGYLRKKTLAAIFHVAPSHSYALFKDKVVEIIGPTQGTAPVALKEQAGARPYEWTPFEALLQE